MAAAKSLVAVEKDSAHGTKSSAAWRKKQGVRHGKTGAGFSGAHRPASGMGL
jgi:hypothetical protein